MQQGPQLQLSKELAELPAHSQKQIALAALQDFARQCLAKGDVFQGVFLEFAFCNSSGQTFRKAFMPHIFPNLPLNQMTDLIDLVFADAQMILSTDNPVFSIQIQDSMAYQKLQQAKKYNAGPIYRRRARTAPVRAYLVKLESDGVSVISEDTKTAIKG